MKKTILTLLSLTCLLAAVPAVRGDDVLDITHTGNVFGKKPVPVALSGFSGEGLEVLRFDLYVQGFTFVAPAAAQYVIQGSDAGNDRSGGVQRGGDVAGLRNAPFQKRIRFMRGQFDAGNQLSEDDVDVHFDNADFDGDRMKPG